MKLTHKTHKTHKPWMKSSKSQCKVWDNMIILIIWLWAKGHKTRSAFLLLMITFFNVCNMFRRWALSINNFTPSTVTAWKKKKTMLSQHVCAGSKHAEHVCVAARYTGKRTKWVWKHERHFYGVHSLVMRNRDESSQSWLEPNEAGVCLVKQQC